MTELAMSREQRFGLRAVQIAASLSYLTGQTEWFSFLENLGKSINVLRSGWLYQEIALNLEPIYIAGRILQMSESYIDELPQTKWSDYQKMMDDVNYIALHDKMSGIFATLGSDPSAVHASRLEVSIVPLDLDKTQADQKD